MLLHLVNELAQQVFRDFEVRDHAVLQRTDGVDLIRRAPEHQLGLAADREHAPRRLVHRDHRGLVQHDAAIFDIDERVRRPEIDGHIRGQHAEQSIEHGGMISLYWLASKSSIGP